MISHTTFNLICWIWIAAAVVTFIVLLKIQQPYGRHTTKNWGPMINNRLGWLIMELPALLVFVSFAVFTTNWQSVLVFTAFALWVLHYFNRAIVFPFRLKTKGKKMPVVIMSSAIFFNLVNGFINGYWIARFAPEITLDFSTILRIIAGAIVFLAGFIINQYHDTLLINLRKGNESGYKIPHGGLFKYVSCPNFLGEIISWLGFFILTLSLPALAFLVWTMANLVPRAIDHHKWYRTQFADYPADRKAVLPFMV